MIKVNELSYTYPGAMHPVLKNISFDIQEGEIFGFLGPSGAGKSTTQKIIYKLLNGFHGNIEVNGKLLSQWGKEYFEHIGVGFELPNHYLKLTAKENLELFASFYPKDRILDFNQLFELVGLEASINQKVEEYSKGMKMRLNFIRAIMHNPDILFFDEPTAGLDPVNAIKIRNHIKELKKQRKTIFITTHNMNTADELCDRVSFIVDGELQLTDVPALLKHKHGKNIVKVELKNGKTAEFALDDLGVNKRFIDFIQHREIQRINTMEATLEEVFIQITGKALAS